MKLGRKNLIEHFRQPLFDLGYTLMNDTITAADALFVKRLENSLYLSLGFSISSYYDAKFTASFYLSKTTRWGSIWGDIPKDSYRRIGAFLTNAERIQYLDKEYCSEGVIDAWWNFNKAEVEKVVKVISVTEKRFLKQEGLISKVENSIEIKELLELSNLVIKTVEDINGEEYVLTFSAKSEINGVPVKWFKAAERVLRSKNQIVNKKTVKNLAGDAWRQNFPLEIT